MNMAFLYVPIDEHTRFLIALVRARALDTETEVRARTSIYWIAEVGRHEHRDEVERLLGEPLPPEIRDAPVHYESDEHRAKCAAAYERYKAMAIHYRNGDSMAPTLAISVASLGDKESLAALAAAKPRPPNSFYDRVLDDVLSIEDFERSIRAFHQSTSNTTEGGSTT